jgi:spore coat protein U-like protein
MKTKFFYSLATASLLFWSSAHADTCTITASPGFSTTYSGAFTSVLSSFTVNCVRVAGDTNNVAYNYTVGVSNGLNSANTNPNKAVSGTNSINYDTYKDAACSTLWGTLVADRLSFTQILSGNSVNTSTVTYRGCIPASQSVPPSVYVDTLTLTVYNGATVKASGTFPVSINTSAVCSITTIPNIALSYTAFSAAAVTANTPFGVTCSNGLAYSMALDRSSDVAVGVNYSLALSALNSPGTGVQQNYTVTATAAAGQAGTCASTTCTGTQVAPHTVTITY